MEKASAAAPVTAEIDEVSVAFIRRPAARMPEEPSPSMAAVTFMDMPFVAFAPAPLPANPIPEEPATAAANAPTKASIDCCAVAVRFRLPAALTLEFRILAWTSPGWFLEMIAGRD